MTYAKLGSVSTATLRPEDLLQAFISTLEGLQLANGKELSRPENFNTRDRLQNLIGEAQDVFGEDGETIPEENEERAAELIEEFIQTLDSYAPPFAYFGAHPGDGADFGFWLCEDWQQMARDEDALFKEDGTPIPATYSGSLVVSVSDHGNATLYGRDAQGVWRELWSVV